MHELASVGASTHQAPTKMSIGKKDLILLHTFLPECGSSFGFPTHQMSQGETRIKTPKPGREAI